VLGSVGTLSGPAGTALVGGPSAVQAWARAMNDRGGLDGHPVQVIVVDDGADPARYRAAVQDLVENRGVFAFVSNMAAFTLSAARDYLEQKRVPVIGGDLSSPMWHTSSMFFPQAGGELTQIYGVVANAAATGKKRFASLTCQEAQGCRDADHYWHEEGYAAQVGLEPVFRAKVSIAQPDFTAECLGAQRAGAEILAVVVDASSILRVARSCDRQGYRPLFTMAGASTEEKLASENPGPLDGALTAIITFPWVLSDTPATAEFNATMRRYAPNTLLTATTSMGWVSAKLFERAATGLGPNLDRERLLDNLWRLRGETLGGLTAPLTFVREKPNPDAGCWFLMRIAGRKWTAPVGAKPSCRTVK
jgi:branched-chain amino acid transport system substrate-binding protein